MARERVQLPFGGGLDRHSGIAVVSPAAFADLRETHLGHGRAELRKGHTLRQTLPDDEAIVGVISVRATGLGVILSYASSSGEVSLWQAVEAADSVARIGTIWTLPVGSAPPIVHLAEAYGRVFIAHDEAVMASRQETKVYTVGFGTIDGLWVDLDGTGANWPAKFRGVYAWRSFMVGWGYGSHTEEDRPEIVRVSIPADVMSWDAAHYFVAGQRDDPVVVCRETGTRLTAFKNATRYPIHGSSALDFGILQAADTQYGCVGPRLALADGPRCYFWTHEGPRVTTGDPSEDLALALDLGGVPPDALAASADPTTGFACYLPNRREILWIFGRWVYVLHLEDPDLARWSYRQLPEAIQSGAVLYDVTGTTTGGVVVGAPTADPVYTGATPAARSIGVLYSVSGALLGGETVELWAKGNYESGYTLRGTAAVTGLNNLVTATGLNPGTPYDLALRFKRGGQYKATYTNANPALWPAAAQGAATTAIGDAPTIGDDYFERTAAGWASFHLDIAVAAAPNLTYEAEISPTGLGAWTSVAVLGASAVLNGPELTLPNADIGAESYFRVRVISTHTSGTVTGAWSTPTPKWVGPKPPSAIVVEAEATLGEYLVTATRATLPGGLYAPAFAAITAGAAGTWTATVELTRPATDPFGPFANATIFETLVGVCPTTAPAIFARGRTEITAFGVTDVSDWSASPISIIPNC